MSDDDQDKKTKRRIQLVPPTREVKRKMPSVTRLPFALPEPDEDEEEVDLIGDPDQPIPVAKLNVPLRLQMEVLSPRGEPQGAFEPTFWFLMEWFREHGVGVVHVEEIDRLRFAQNCLDDLMTAIDIAVENGHQMPEDLKKVWNATTKKLEDAGLAMPGGNNEEEEDDECDD